MSFTYKDDLIDVPGTGLRLCTIENESIENFEWKEGHIRLYDLGNKKIYEIYISDNHNREHYRLIIRPRKKYACHLFQQVFNFSGKCVDYTEDRIVGLY
tara:strand:+ start:120 stop:416 length:297 start_codon:yes stop_codon:yes gene_type:complete